MKSKTSIGIVLTLLLIGMLTLGFNIQPIKAQPRTWYVNDDGGADFTKIQDAINAASDGDTIFVYSGTYHENIVVNKDDLTLVGEDKEATIIDGQGTGNVVYLTADNITISSFSIQNSGLE